MRRPRSSWSLHAVAVVSIAATACGDDSSGEGGGGSTSGSLPGDRTEQVCDRWVDAVCTATARCLGEFVSYKECVDSYDCSKAKSADSKAVEKCEQQLPAADCASLSATVAGFCEDAVEFPDGSTTVGQGGAGGASTGTGGGDVGDPLAPPTDTCQEWCAEVAALAEVLACSCAVFDPECTSLCQQITCGAQNECEASTAAVTCAELGLAEGRFELGCGGVEDTGECIVIGGGIDEECGLLDHHPGSAE